MIAREIYNQFIIYEFGNATRSLPIDAQPNVRLAVLIVIIVNNDIGTALQSIFYKFFNAWKLFFSNLSHIFAEFETVLAEVGIEILGLIIFPLKFLVLHTVLSKLYRIYLALHVHQNSKAKNRGDDLLHTVTRFLMILNRSLFARGSPQRRSRCSFFFPVNGSKFLYVLLRPCFLDVWSPKSPCYHLARGSF